MPELPEVETVRIGLQKLIVGKTIASITFDWQKSFPNDAQLVNSFLIGATIIAVRRRAKVLLIDVSTEYSLVIHLKMTGQLVFRGEQSFGAGHPNDSLIGELPDKSTRVTFVFDDESSLFFNDQRKFGWVRLVPTAEVPFIDFMKRFGPEPLEPNFTRRVFAQRLLRRKNTSIKAVLLDQTVIAGIGNIYADESLFIAGIDPASIVHAIPQSRINSLHSAIISVLRLSIEKGGSTDRNYVNVEGKKGSYINFANVFRKENQPCPNGCGTLVQKRRLAGRGTHSCLSCQKVYS